MIATYLKFALRALSRQRIFTAINIVSLSIGIAFSALAITLLSASGSFDRFHSDYASIYRASGKIKSFNISNTPAPLGPALASSYAQVSGVTRIADREVVLNMGTPERAQALFADPNFFTFFDFTIASGNAGNALASGKSIVLTQATAKKFFGHEQVIGSTVAVSIDGQEELFTVSAIANEVPEQSSISYDFILPLSALFLQNPADMESDWDSYSLTTFIKVDPAGLTSIESSIPDFVSTHFGDNLRAEGSDPADYKFIFEPLADYHARGTHASGMIAPRDPRVVKVFGWISAFILLIALFNFSNLAAAQTYRRIAETSIRKVMGAGVRNLVVQYMLEGMVLSTISLLLAIILIAVAEPVIEQVFNIPFSLGTAGMLTWAGIATITIGTGVLIGVGTVALQGRASLASVLRKTHQTRERRWLTGSGLAVQFSVAMVLLVCALIISMQQHFVSTFDKGYEDGNVLVLHTNGALTRQGYDQFRNNLMSVPGVSQVSAVSHNFSHGNSAFIIRQEGQPMQAVFDYRADENYISLLDLELKAGQPATREKQIAVNEAFVKSFNLEQPVGLVLDERFGSLAGRQITGVLRDYHFQSLMNGMSPMALSALDEDDVFRGVLVKYETGSLTGLVEQVQQQWRAALPSEPFTFTFLQDDVMKDYEAEERWNSIARWSALLAVGIAMLGVFGITSLQLVRRIREIGIRRVLGASGPSIVKLFQRQYLLIVVVAQVLSLPLTWWAAGEWLSNFVYKAEMPWYVFVSGGAVTLLMTLLLSAFQVAYAAKRNPAEVLRTE